MNQQINNAASKFINLGVDDRSKRRMVREAVSYPQHLPLHFIFAQTGQTEPTPCAGNARLITYGEDTFSERSPYFKHTTLFANAQNAIGNTGMYVRLIPKDAGPKPTIRIAMDILATQIDDYARNPDGSIKLKADGTPTVVGQITGYSRKFVRLNTPMVDEDGESNFGALEITEGSQRDPVTGTVSRRIPLFDFEHNFFGKNGDLSGIRLWPMNKTNSSQLPTKMMAKEKAYPYNFAVVRKNAKTGSAAPVDSVFTEKFIYGTFKEGSVDPSTDMDLNLGDRMYSAYENLTDTRYPIQYGDFGRVHVYQDNLDALLKELHAAEIPFITGGSDFTADEDDFGLYNFLTCTSTQNVPYHSVIDIDDGDSIRFSSSTNLYAEGGSDGTMTNETLADLVSEYMQRYADENDELQDVAYNVETYLWDSGFPLDTKYDLIKFISVRKNTFVGLATHTDGERPLSASEELSVAISLQNRLEMYPESTYFNTPVYRGLVQAQSASVLGSTYKKKTSATYDLCQKFSSYFGAGNGNWKMEEAFDGYPGHLVTTMADFNVRWVPPSLGARFWDASVNWVSRSDRETFYYPQFKTVYNDDTSVLTGVMMAQVLITMNSILAKVHRRNTGTMRMTEAQFTDHINTQILNEVKGKFDPAYVIIPRAQFTSMDQIRAFSWTVPVDVYGPNMRTVMTGYLVSRRSSDLNA